MPHPENHGPAAPPSDTVDDLRELRAQLDATFRAELSERLPRMRLALSRLTELTDGDAREVLLHELARDAHSIKGGAMVVGRESVARIAQALETRFDDEINRRDRSGPTVGTAAFGKALDAIESLAGANAAEPRDSDALAERTVAAMRSDTAPEMRSAPADDRG